jgi:hypothetical protein
MGSLIIIDVGCSYGVAPRRMKEYLGESGISSYVIGLDLARGSESGLRRIWIGSSAAM